MENNLRLKFSKNSLQAFQIPDIPFLRTDLRTDQLKMPRVVRPRQREAADLRSQMVQPERQPRSLESGMTGQQYFFPFVAVVKHALISSAGSTARCRISRAR